MPEFICAIWGTHGKWAREWIRIAPIRFHNCEKLAAFVKIGCATISYNLLENMYKKQNHSLYNQYGCPPNLKRLFFLFSVSLFLNEFV